MKKKIQPIVRVMRNIAMNPDGCWEWKGSKADGYGYIGINGSSKGTHRITFEHYVAPIPAGLQIDHLCRNRACCNPIHLEIVTPQENIARRPPFSNAPSKRTHCPQGHEYTEANTYVWDNTRKCRTCHRLHQQRCWSKRNSTLSSLA